MTANIKYFDSARHTGCPAANAVAGNLLAFLDACLLSGFNTVTVSSLTSSGGTSTLVASNHGYQVGQWLLVAGANESQYNTEVKVKTVVDANTLTFDTPSGAPASATGTITAKVAPLGWTKPFSGTNLAAYRAPTGKQHYLRVDDTNTYGAVVWGAETMSSISAGTGIYPGGGGTSFVNTCEWQKAYTSPYRYILVGDDRRFFLLPAVQASQYGYNVYFFGDYTPYNASDASPVMLAADRTLSYLSGGYAYPAGYSQGTYMTTSPSAKAYLSRSAAGALAGDGVWLARGYPGGAAWASGSPTSFSYDTQTPLQAIVALGCEVFDVTAGGFGMRGNMPGLYMFPQKMTGLFATGNVITLGGKDLLLVLSSVVSNTAGMAGFDLTGPW
ncbi:hypothetical protein RA280_14465 [Cupriavidus sp. CV2]|uniref:hypothetical protein n=1 Tax=Cupriavidus ulmosensis TaxID=3065913 RepID=UPI00296ABEB1|nr:hypothetical protein [Cupriavidus sp. CV2]MDW3682929.1 hypothetical protein [Cupriavidus sp. CV2]